MKIQKRTLPNLEVRAQAGVRSLNEERRTVELTWSTGSKGIRAGWDGPYYEELSLKPEHVDLSRLNDGSHPLLAAHNDRDLDSVIGVIERASVDGTQGIATVRFAKDEISERVFQKIKDGILKNVSVGYSVQKYEETSQAGDIHPTFLATRWRPHEISVVPVGFDPAAKVRTNQNENEVEILTNRLEGEGKNLMTPEMKEKIKAEERTRALDIRKLVREANLPEKMAEDYISNDTSVEQVRTNIQLFTKYQQEQKAEAVSSHTRVQVGESDSEKKLDAAIEATLHRIDPFAYQTLMRTMEGIIGRRPGVPDAKFIRQAMSSSDLPYLLANVAEKSAQKRFDISQQTYRTWVRNDKLSNFKTADRVRVGSWPSLEERQEAGEFKRGSLSEEREQVQLKEYGKILPFTRRMLINDDLGELAKIAAEAGHSASQLENSLAYAQLSSNPTMGDGELLFSSAHDNQGTTGALTDVQIGEAFKLMRLQRSVDNQYRLNLSPKYLICSPENEIAARKYLAQINPAQASNVNVFSGALELVVDAALTANDYFFAADQNQIDTVVMYHLEGEERPRVESRTDFESESVEIKCAHSCVAKAMDWRGLVINGGGS
jgi:hypothetical protein